jgi:hypothetical protein
MAAAFDRNSIDQARDGSFEAFCRPRLSARPSRADASWLDCDNVEGDRRAGVGSLPVRLGVDPAARLACIVMAAPQAIVIALLVTWDRPVNAIAVGVLLRCSSR